MFVQRNWFNELGKVGKLGSGLKLQSKYESAPGSVGKFGNTLLLQSK